MELQSLNITNFFCIEFAELDFHKQGLVLLLGENLDVSDSDFAESNLSGKSSLLEAICRWLYDRTFRRVRSGKDVIRRGAKTCVLDGIVNGQRLRREYGKGKNLLFLGEKEVSQSDLDNFLGMNWNEFFNFSMFGDKDAGTEIEMFGSSTNSEKFKALSPILKNEKWDHGIENAKREYNSKLSEIATQKDAIIKSNLRITELKSSIATNQENIDRMVPIIEQKKTDLKEYDVDLLNNTRKDLSQKLSSIAADCILLSKSIEHIKLDIENKRKEYQGLQVIREEKRGYEVSLAMRKKNAENTKLLCENENEFIERFDRANKSVIISGDICKVCKNQLEKAGLEITDAKKQLEVEKEKLQTLCNEKYKISVRKTALEKRLEEIHALIKQGKCPTCGSDISDGHNFMSEISRVEKSLNEVNVEIDSYKGKIFKAEESINIMQNYISENEGFLEDLKVNESERKAIFDKAMSELGVLDRELHDRQKAKGELSIIEQDILKYTELLQNCVTKLESESIIIEQGEELKLKLIDAEKKEKELSDEKNELQLIIKGIESKIEAVNKLDKDITELKDQIVDIQNKIGNSSDELSECEDAVKSMERSITDLEDDGKHVSFWIDGYGDKGCRSEALKAKIPEINDFIASFIPRVLNSDYQIQLSAVRETKSKTIKNEIEIVMDGEYFSKSKSERMRIDLVLSLALGAMYPKKCNCLFFDELLASLDSRGTEVVINMFKALIAEDYYESIFVISHKDIDLFENKWIVKKANGAARLYG